MEQFYPIIKKTKEKFYPKKKKKKKKRNKSDNQSHSYPDPPKKKLKIKRHSYPKRTNGSSCVCAFFVSLSRVKLPACDLWTHSLSLHQETHTSFWVLWYQKNTAPLFIYLRRQFLVRIFSLSFIAIQYLNWVSMTLSFPSQILFFVLEK